NYLRSALLFATCFILNFTFTAFVRNDYAPRLARSATLLSSLFNIAFDYIFMFPCGMGMKGAALATGLSPVVSMLICMIHYLSANNTIRFRPVR
ncbi:MAG: MATE family efflux transporter, partial [Lachnospiraceae bacterium]|nr:MATE family efflux transporter [Lachnospiraceae bacterium]